MSYLKIFKNFFLNFFSRDKFESSIEENEPITRFIDDPRKIYANTQQAKPSAFKHHSTRRDLSVYRKKNCKDYLIWRIAEKFVDKKRTDGKKVLARADFDIELVRSRNVLVLNPDGKPHKRHMNIENWPNDSISKMIRVELSGNSELFKKP